MKSVDSMINVFGPAMHGPMRASIRVRPEQFLLGFAHCGICLGISVLLGGDYLRTRFLGGFLRLSSTACKGVRHHAQLQRALDITELRHPMGEVGRTRVEDHCAHHVTLPKCATRIHRLAGK